MSTKITRLFWVLVAVLVAFGIVAMALDVPVVGHVSVIAGLSLAFFWLLSRLMRRLLFRVGRRLAFTYFLIGALPIPMVIFLIFVAAYLLSAFFLGHLYRDALTTTQEELVSAAETRLTAVRQHGALPAQSPAGLAFGYYRNGRRVAGDPRTPETWPSWLGEISHPDAEATPEREVLPPLVALQDGSPTMAVAREGQPFGVVAFYDGDLEAHLSQHSDVGVELMQADDPRKESVVQVQILGEQFVFLPLRRQEAAAEGEGFSIFGFDMAGPLLSLADGSVASENISVALTAPASIVSKHLFPTSAEVDTRAWLMFIIPAFLLLDVYALALFMAILMILGLSRAVNQLSGATAGVQEGDFSVRIPVRRRDQLGALQRSFNQMTENLESLVSAATQKEILEKELQIARDLQKSLLPSEVVQGESVEFATFFEPSAAIGGDYFDILHLDDDRLAVVIADVSGHGLSAGLRMAMVKAALLILMEEEKEPEEILGRLDRLIRSSDETHSYVTSTLSFLDLGSGVLELTNAGHPPTYLVRGGEVEEILLPGSPLGALSSTYGQRKIHLQPGDTVVWLSDGFIEAPNPAGEPFGYTKTLDTLRGDTSSVTAVRDRLLEAVDAHTRDQPVQDDCTLVVMRYLSAACSSAA